MVNLLKYTNGSYRIVDRIIEISMDLMRSEIRKNLPEDQPIPPDSDELIKLYCYGMFGYVHETMKKGDFDSNHVADVCEHGLPYMLRFFLYG
jgi:hypothetical protein